MTKIESGDVRFGGSNVRRDRRPYKRCGFISVRATGAYPKLHQRFPRFALERFYVVNGRGALSERWHEHIRKLFTEELIVLGSVLAPPSASEDLKFKVGRIMYHHFIEEKAFFRRATQSFLRDMEEAWAFPDRLGGLMGLIIDDVAFARLKARDGKNQTHH